MKALQGFIALVAMTACVLTGDAFAGGILHLTNSVSGTGNKVVLVSYNSAGVLDGKDGFDQDWIHTTAGADVYSDIGTAKLRSDWRNSNTPYVVRLVYDGTVSAGASNTLELYFPYGAGWRFEEKRYLTLRELDGSGQPGPNAWNVFSVIAQGGTIPLGQLAPGIYKITSPYRSFQLDFEPLISGSALFPARVGLVRDGDAWTVQAMVSPGFTHVIEARNNLASGSWQGLGTNSVAFAGSTNQVPISFGFNDIADLMFFRVRSY